MLDVRQRKEWAIRSVFFCVALASITILVLIVIFLFVEGLPIFKHVSVKDFLFGEYWYPTADPPDFGIFPLITASIAVTVISALLSIPLGVMTAIYLAEIATPRVREWVKPMVELLAALPSVVIGFFGMVVVAPVLQDTFDLATGLNLFNAVRDARLHVDPDDHEYLRRRHLQRSRGTERGVPRLWGRTTGRPSPG